MYINFVIHRLNHQLQCQYLLCVNEATMCNDQFVACLFIAWYCCYYTHAHALKLLCQYLDSGIYTLLCHVQALADNAQFTYFSSIILDAQNYLSCLKFCWHNLPGPSLMACNGIAAPLKLYDIMKQVIFITRTEVLHGRYCHYSVSVYTKSRGLWCVVQ